MSAKEAISLERLNAFVDGELSADEEAEVMSAMHRDESIAVTICELRHTKDLVQRAYRRAAIPEMATPVPCARGPRPWLAIAATLLIGLFAGWMAPGLLNHAPDSPAEQVATLLRAQPGEQRVVLHVDTDDNQRVAAALDEIDALMADPGTRHVRLDVVANAGGLDMLRSDTSPFKERIHRLVTQHPNVEFLACSRAIERLRLKGVPVHLIPDAKPIPGALEALVERLRAGWVYIRA